MKRVKGIMVTVNNVGYTSYLEMCKAHNIDYKDFLKFKVANPNIGELDLLGEFIPDLAYCMFDSTYRQLGVVRDTFKPYKPGG